MENLISTGPTPSSLINGSEVSMMYSDWSQIGGFCLGVELAGGESNRATLLNSLGYTGPINYIDCSILTKSLFSNPEDNIQIIVKIL